MTSGATRQAAYAAWVLFYDHLLWGNEAVAAGWLRRMRRHLEKTNRRIVGELVTRTQENRPTGW